MPTASAPAAPPRPAPVSAPAASVPVPKPAPEPPAPAAIPEAKEAADPESANVSVAKIWETIAETFAKDSFIRFGWLRDGLFERLEAGQLFVRFPASARDASETVFMEQGRKDINARLSRELSKPVTIAFEFDENAVEPPEPEPFSDEPAEAPKAADVPLPPSDPMGDFKDDPLIKKALEIFKSTLQPNP